ncbi:Hypothetical predicted protein [Marmota monax]|uniref:Uncharacterized protein n=1 Tax=Marmota monax TaxID=9995 RepID=A0A5E4ANZ0_MARMO|nr:hypothetical protein GHT09_007820 [Marmota monax]VTJ58222.1 Hypothetical predicted protein [Marmota monax]
MAEADLKARNAPCGKQDKWQPPPKPSCVKSTLRVHEFRLHTGDRIKETQMQMSPMPNNPGDLQGGVGNEEADIQEAKSPKRRGSLLP